ncbi:flagellar M-ring protein FliF [Thermoanaerobacter mathranii subsp. mathranii str. A3]|uniref:Flagellar M-ring protein n=1 Tax=Thermoanaerobacter mathranii subsp. mathranii (strain DSM 11426 / CCUG 53645 / CIP 108742 / A3) TaxID=583358 RepID=A0ABM5LQB9_THEM3|nr:flagellar basal-body MS-ring/collar protein FliF [Thermoanaerobacter mathranii]ADH61001.1 flagellar M-ring protein FliF [Thermoanaerobacter mathranii subsp. mathranii str. A3]
MPDFIANFREQLTNFWNKFDKKQKMQLGVIAILLFIGVSLLVYIVNRPNYVVLYSDLSIKDAGVVVEKLKTEFKVPYKISNDGKTILVPAQYKDEVRMKLATEGIPEGGFSFQDAMNNSLATTDQERRQKYLYFLQNEIQNSLKTIDGVQDAIVNIVVPDQNAFVLSNTTNQATAAVMLTLKPGVTLSSSQVKGIIDFVSKSVEGLKPENVTVIDNNGKILTAESDDTAENANSQFALQKKVQEDLQQNLQTLLEQVFGPGNVVVRANVTLNFDKKTEDRIEYLPVEGNDNKGIVRSIQELKEKATGTQGGNPAGTSSNNPPTTQTTGSNTSDYNKTETTINYEINQIKTSLIEAQGKIESISVAVVVNKNLNNSMKQQIADLVAKAAGGDSRVQVSVQGMQFNQDLLKTMQQQANVSKGVPMYAWAMLAALVLGGGLFFIMMRRKKKETSLATAEEEALATAEPIEEIDFTYEDEKKKQIEKLIKEKPDIVVQIIRTWLNEE